MDRERINVTKTFLPPLEEYTEYLKRIWQSGQLTNQGSILEEFEVAAKDFLRLSHFQFVTNGTLALQIALKALDINEGEIITTPFTYVATTSSILWERCKPVYVDIDPDTLCIDANKIEDAITDKTKAILAVHVFGNMCDVDMIESIAKKHKLKVIYDAAHSFGVIHRGRSALSYGDISICSFHATKLFHTIEGGCIVANDHDVDTKIELIKRFGHNQDDHIMLGINAKASEFQAAMGLCNLKYVSQNIEARREVSSLYDNLLDGLVTKQYVGDTERYNYAYYPVILKDEHVLLRIIDALTAKNIHPRRYFYPSLNTIPYVSSIDECLISEDVARRILCLPLYPGIDKSVIEEACRAIALEVSK